MGKLKKRVDGRYQKKLAVGRDDAGKVTYKYFYAATPKELADAVRAYQNALDGGMEPKYDKSTFAELRKRWIEQRELDDIGEAWLRNLKQYAAHLSVLDEKKASDITRGDIQDILNKLAQWHDGCKPLAYRTLSRIRKAAVEIFDFGIPEMLQYNPAIKVKVPQGAGVETREPIPDYQQAWIREFPHRAKRAAMLMMLSGLRRGEASALTWADVDLLAGTIHVQRSVDFVTGKVKGPKSEAGKRIVIIPQELTAYLSAEKQSEGDAFCMYVIHQTNGARMTNSGWHKMWDSYMTALNAHYGHHGANVHAPRKKAADGSARGALPMVIKVFTPHQLRHTYATLLYLAGVDVLTARDQLGHSDIKTTLEIYTHLDKLYKRHSMDKFSAYLSQSSQTIAR